MAPAFGLMRQVLLLRCMHTAAAFARSRLSYLSSSSSSSPLMGAGVNQRAAASRMQLSSLASPIAPHASMPPLHGHPGGGRGNAHNGRRGERTRLGAQMGQVVQVDAKQRHALQDVQVSEAMRQALQDKGFESLTAIQAAVFPDAKQGKDVLARSRTGTGKTVAFSLPLLEQLAGNKPSSAPQMLVLCPTRELAKQVYDEIDSIGSKLGLRGTVVYGGTPYARQQADIRNGVHFLVGTPGRLEDLMKNDALSLDHVRHVVLDEADRMLDMGFAEQVERILQSTPSDRQTLLFSATIPSWVTKLSTRFMKEHVYVDAVGDDDTRLATTISHTAIKLPSTPRDAAIGMYLEDVILMVRADKIKQSLATGEQYTGGKTLIFFNTKDECVRAISGDTFSIFKAAALHGDMGQSQRDITLAEFKSGKIDVLVATDVAARGLDVSDIEYVIHCYPPRDPDTYVHRSGRTGRAERKGDVVVLFQESESRSLKDLERELDFKFQTRSLPSWNATVSASALFSYAQLSKVDKDISKDFSQSATEILSASGGDTSNTQLVSLVARSLAAVSGRFTKEPRSLLTAAPGRHTLMLTADTHRSLTTPAVVAKLKQMMREIPNLPSDIIYTIRLCTDYQSACFDVSSPVAKVLLENTDKAADFRLEDVSTLPELVPAAEPQQNNRFRSGGRGGFDRSRGFSRDRDFQHRDRDRDRDYGSRPRGNFGSNKRSGRDSYR